MQLTTGASKLFVRPVLTQWQTDADCLLLLG